MRRERERGGGDWGRLVGEDRDFLGRGSGGLMGILGQ